MNLGLFSFLRAVETRAALSCCFRTNRIVEAACTRSPSSLPGATSYGRHGVAHTSRPVHTFAGLRTTTPSQDNACAKMASSAGDTKKPDEVLYFAYGSNMWSHRMHIRNPTAKFFATGELEGYYVGFVDDARAWQGATAALRENARRTTHGVVWSIPRENIHILDQQEEGYEGSDVSVKLSSGEKVVCRTYFYLASKAGKPSKPSVVYKAVVVAGALEHKLPTDYVQELVNNPDNGNRDGITIPVDIEKLRPFVNGYIDL